MYMVQDVRQAKGLESMGVTKIHCEYMGTRPRHETMVRRSICERLHD